MTRIRKSFSALLLILVFVALGAQGTSAQQGVPQARQQASVAPDSQQSRSTGDAQALRDLVAMLEQRVADKYLARLDALAMEKRTFEWTIRIFTTLIATFAVAGAIVAYRFGKSFKELRDSVREDAAATFRKEFFGNADQLKEVAELKRKYETARESLEKIAQELQGYSALAEAAERASGFDPLVEYFSIDREIDKRFEKTRAMLAGDDSIPVSKTTYDKEFRQRAAVVFERLLEAVRRGRDEGETPKVGPLMLYNAAANASKAGLDFVSLELMRTAFEMSGGQAPEIASRYIRQQLSMSVISADEAKSRIRAVLENTSGFDVHLAVSEAFNIGMGIADPSGMADLIECSLPEDLRGISYVLFNSARLRLMGNMAEDWVAAEQTYSKGLQSFANESPTARWYKHSGEELSHILRERPDFASSAEPALGSVLGKCPTLEAFVARFGEPLAQTLLDLEILDQFVEEAFVAKFGEPLAQTLLDLETLDQFVEDDPGAGIRSSQAGQDE